MKCPKCQTDNKEGAKTCRKCGYDLIQVPLWKPTWKWHLRTLAVIYVILIVAFFALNHVLKPYMRKIPHEITPWLKEVPKEAKVG
ncbi:MAG: zinc-ribbon domain-containing protein [Endomicrobiales bacterium]|nr:zinc-ribbon domain-containing protein [Endomicrobiales bacterium]